MTTVVSVAQGGTGSNSAALARTALGVPPSAAYDQANTARDQANTARTQANSAYAQANSAYSDANTRLSASGGTLAGDLIITGNLTVSGNSTTLNAEILTIEDADVVLLSNVASTPALNAGIIVNRGTSTNTFLRWDEVTDKWGWSDDGSTTYKFTSALDAYAQANSAYGAANNRVLKAGDTMTGQLNISAGGLLVTGNVGIGTSSPTEKIDVAGNIAITGTGALSLQRALIPSGADSGTPQLAFKFYSTGTTYTVGAQIQALSAAAWSSTSAPTNLIFYTCPSGSTTLSERLRIDSAGNLGIGTSGPVAKLDVVGGNGDGIQYRTSTRSIGIGQISSQASLFWGSSTDLTFFAGSELARLTSGGNLGLGTTSPTNTAGFSRQLQISGTTAALTLTSSTGGSNYSLGAGSAGDFGLWNNTTSSYRWYVDSSGNVGVGTSSPAGYGKFTVFGTGYIGHFNSTSGSVGIGFYENGTGRFYIKTLNGSDGLAFIDGDGTTEHMRINASGNVGIGTTSPGSRLSVNGTIESLIDNFGGSEGGQFVLRAASGGSYRWNLDNYGSGTGNSLRIFREDDSTSANGVVAVTINSALRVGIGTDSFNTNGGKLQVADGISFPATQSACSDANTLDDYEEGTWTPELRDGATVLTQGYSYRSGVYHKIGRMVHIHFGFLLSSLSGTSTNALRVYGLPFTGATTGGYQEPMGYAILGNQPTAAHSNQVYFFNGTGSAYLEARLLNGVDTVYTSNNIDGDTFMKFSMIYWV